MANNTRQISIFLDGKQAEGTIKNIAGAFREASNRLAKMVVGSQEYLDQLGEVQKYSEALAEHRNRIRGVETENEAAAGSVNALSQEYQAASKTLNNLTINSDEYRAQLQKVQALEAALTQAKQQQQAQNLAVAGSVNAMEQEYREATKALNMMVVGSDEYNAQLKEVQALEAALTETRNKQKATNVAVAGSLRAMEEELQQEKIILRDLVIGSKEYQEQLKKVAALEGTLEKHQQSLKGIGQGWSLAKVGLDNFVGVAAGAFAVDSLIGYGKQLYGVGVQMDALDKKARTVFGDTLPQVSAEAEKNAAAMGLTTSQYINAAAAIQDILIPMGFQRKEAADISTQLTNLSGALSEWTGGQVSATQVSEILSSALTGEREQLKQLGIVLQQSDIDARLTEKGLGKLTGTMRQQAEAAATLELILEKSTDAQTGFANGADSAVRRQAELAAKTQDLIEKISKGLLPVFDALVKVASGVADAFSFIIDPMAETTEESKSLAEQTKKTQAEFNAEIAVLTEGNFTQEERAKLIREINSRYSEYLPNLISEKASIDDIREAQEAANKVFAQKIVYVAFQEKITAAAKEAAQATDAAFEAERRKQEILQKTRTEDDLRVQQSLQLQAQLNQAIRDNAVETVKNAPKQAEEIRKVYEQLAASLGTTLAEIEKTFGPQKNAGTGTGSGGKDAVKEAEKTAKELEDLIKRTTEFRLELISKAQDDEITIAIRGIEKRYEAEIAKAKELEEKGVTEATALRVELEKLKGEEILKVTREIAEKGREDLEKQLEEEAKVKAEADEKAKKAKQEALEKENEDRAAAFDEIKSFTQENLLSDQEQELLQLEEHYNHLRELAKKYGADTTAITQAYEAAKAAAVKDSTEQRLKYEKDLADAQAELEQYKVEAFGQSAAILGGFFEETTALGKALFLFEKAAAAVSVILSLQKEKAAILAATRLGTIFEPTGILGAALAAPQLAAANIRAGISLATIAATAIKPFVKQKAEGGYLSVTGEDDHRTYNAAIIPPPDTGILPHHPVLFQSQATGAPVLASERGAEYFVSAESLRNPYVANLTRMIDNITVSGGRGVPQFAEGGVNQATVAPITATAPAVDMSIIARNTVVMEALLKAIDNGIVAIIPDRTVTAIPERFGKINEASGGYYG